MTPVRDEFHAKLHRYQIAAEAADCLLRGMPTLPVPQEFTDRDEALAWLDAERENLLAATRTAAVAGQDHAAGNLSSLIAYYLDFRGRFDDLLAVTAIGLEAARRLGDRAAEGEAMNNRGSALVGLGRYDDARAAYRDAISILREAESGNSEATASANLAALDAGILGRGAARGRGGGPQARDPEPAG